MTKLLIRHGLSEANNRFNIGTPAFGNPDAPLMLEGHEQAQKAGKLLVAMYGLSILETDVAVSTMLRTQETASSMGLHNQSQYPLLDEVKHGIRLPLLRERLDCKILPSFAILAARDILDNPPPEDIWVTHGLVIAGLCEVLDVHEEEWRFIPEHCEMRELPI